MRGVARAQRQQPQGEHGQRSAGAAQALRTRWTASPRSMRTCMAARSVDCPSWHEHRKASRRLSRTRCTVHAVSTHPHGAGRGALGKRLATDVSAYRLRGTALAQSERDTAFACLLCGTHSSRGMRVHVAMGRPHARRVPAWDTRLPPRKPLSHTGMWPLDAHPPAPPPPLPPRRCMRRCGTTRTRGTLRAAACARSSSRAQSGGARMHAAS